MKTVEKLLVSLLNLIGFDTNFDFIFGNEVNWIEFLLYKS